MKHQPQPKFARIPPNAVPLEETVLGAILLDRNALQDVAGILKPETFYDPRHEKIYRSILALYNRMNPIDAMTVMEELRRKGELEAIGGPAYLAGLTMKVGSAANIEYHSRILQQQEIRRALIQAAMVSERDAYDDSIDAFELLDKVEQSIFQVGQSVMRGSEPDRAKLARKALDNLTAMANRTADTIGITTGFSGIDKYTMGVQPQDLWIIGGRPGMGKTTFGVYFALAAALAGKPVAFFSMGDLSAQKLAEKIILIMAGVPFLNIRNKTVTPEQQAAIAQATEAFTELPLKIFDLSILASADISAIRSWSRKLVSSGTELIVCDYLQQIGHQDHKDAYNRVSAVSRELKILAGSLNVGMIVPAQLSRAVEGRGGDKRPILSDLRESGQIEQDADMVAFLYRPEYYNVKEDTEGNSTAGITEFIIAKDRMGGDPRPIRLFYNHDLGRHEDTQREPTFDQKLSATLPAIKGNGGYEDLPF